MKFFFIILCVFSIFFSQIFLIKLNTNQSGNDGLSINNYNRTSNLSENNVESTIVSFNVSGMVISHENLTMIPYLYGTVNITETH
jgi:hypothetical protein